MKYSSRHRLLRKFRSSKKFKGNHNVPYPHARYTPSLKPISEKEEENFHKDTTISEQSENAKFMEEVKKEIGVANREIQKNIKTYEQFKRQREETESKTEAIKKQTEENIRIADNHRKTSAALKEENIRIADNYRKRSAALEEEIGKIQQQTQQYIDKAKEYDARRRAEDEERDQRIRRSEEEHNREIQEIRKTTEQYRRETEEINRDTERIRQRREEERRRYENQMKMKMHSNSYYPHSPSYHHHPYPSSPRPFLFPGRSPPLRPKWTTRSPNAYFPSTRLFPARRKSAHSSHVRKGRGRGKGSRRRSKRVRR